MNPTENWPSSGSSCGGLRLQLTDTPQQKAGWAQAIHVQACAFNWLPHPHGKVARLRQFTGWLVPSADWIIPSGSWQKSRSPCASLCIQLIGTTPIQIAGRVQRAFCWLTSADGDASSYPNRKMATLRQLLCGLTSADRNAPTESHGSQQVMSNLQLIGTPE